MAVLADRARAAGQRSAAGRLQRSTPAVLADSAARVRGARRLQRPASWRRLRPPRPFDPSAPAPPRNRNFGPDAKPQHGPDAKAKKKEAERPRGPIPTKFTGRSFSLDDDEARRSRPDIDDFATSKPSRTRGRQHRGIGVSSRRFSAPGAQHLLAREPAPSSTRSDHAASPCGRRSLPPPTRTPRRSASAGCRAAATYDAIVYPSTEYRHPRCRSMTVAEANGPVPGPARSCAERSRASARRRRRSSSS